MMTRQIAPTAQVADGEWVTLEGGELEGRRPAVVCDRCRSRRSVPRDGALCFQCYRAGVERERAIGAAAVLDTASEARFQAALPFEPVDHARLACLRAERSTARAASITGIRQFVDRRRRAQIEARHALQRLAEGLRARLASGDLTRHAWSRERAQALAGIAHAAELQLPESWLPFVVAR
jgi:hypothetical protein